MPPIDSETTHWFVEHLQPHEPSLRAYLRSSLSSASDVDDVVQDTYTRILKMRQTTDIRSGQAILFAVARNTVRDMIRRQSVAQHEPITETAASSVLQDKADVVEFVSRQQELAMLADAIRALPTRCREVLLLRKIQGLSQKEISARLDITENTVETLIAKGTHRCREYLRKLGAGSPPSL